MNRVSGMKWSYRIGQVAGIGVYVHATFWLLVAAIVGVRLLGGDGLFAAAVGGLFVLAIFVCILLHELGHALMARRFGIATRDITLLPIGGLARLERMPEDPRQELLVALAGPAVNVAIVVLLLPMIAAIDSVEAIRRTPVAGEEFLTRLVFANVALVLFNLLPAFPMDGGRVLRALLAKKLHYVRATQIAAGIGQAMAVVFAVVGVMSNWMLLLVAWFVFVGARQEAMAVSVRSMLRGVPVQEAMVTRFQTVAESDGLDTVTRELLASDQQDFPVLRGSEVAGVLTRSALLAALAQGRVHARAGEVLTGPALVVEETSSLDETVRRMQEDERRVVPVVRDRRLVGIVTLENLEDWLAVRSSLREAGERGTQNAASLAQHWRAFSHQ
jgi:Zn-dependent protease